MERLLARLERRFGQRAPGNLTYILIGAQLTGLMLSLSSPAMAASLPFDIHAIMRGEVWRVVTWLAIPPSLSPIWAIFGIYWLYVMGTALESQWGAFKFLVYWSFGVIGTMLAATIAQWPADNRVFIMTLFLAFATLWPDYEIRLFFVLPIKVKWLAYLDAIFLVFYTFAQPGLAMLLPIVSVANFLLFFNGPLRDRLRGMARQAERAGARNRMRAARTASELPKSRSCAICGASNDDPEVELRICDCAKCGVRRELCLPHLRNH